MSGYEQLFSSSLTIPEIESILKTHANHSKISAHIKEHELNIHVAEGTEGTGGTGGTGELDSHERTELIEMNTTALAIFIGNCGRIIQKFADIQLQKPGVNRVYFEFADLNLYPTTSTSIANGHPIQRPEITYVYTAGLYATNALLNYCSVFCQRGKRALAYHRSIPENAYLIPIYEKYIHDETSKLALRIDNCYSLVAYFLRNISSMIFLSTPEDIAYLTRHPDHIYGIIQMLCSCSAVPDRFADLLRDYILELFMSTYIPNPVRHDLFQIITKNSALRSLCFQRVKISMLLDDLTEYLRLGADTGNEYTSHFVCGVLFSAHMIRTKHAQIDDYAYDTLVGIICGILRYVNRVAAEIPGAEQTPEHEEKIFDEIKQCLLSVECFIQCRPDVLQTHLVHFVPYTFVNMIKAYPVPLTICESMRGILSLCSSSPIFANYLATILDDDYLKTNIGFIVPLDHQILNKKRKLMKTLEDNDADGTYVDPIQSTHILNMGAIPMSNGEVIFCDSYVMQTLLRSKPTNPYTNEPMTVDDFIRIQMEPEMAAKIKQICAEKCAFIARVKSH